MTGQWKPVDDDKELIAAAGIFANRTFKLRLKEPKQDLVHLTNMIQMPDGKIHRYFIICHELTGSPEEMAKDLMGPGGLLN
jgi:hypothetical protein